MTFLLTAIRVVAFASAAISFSSLSATEMPSRLADMQHRQQHLATKAAQVTVGIRQVRGGDPGSNGSGVIISRDGLILTAAHVVSADEPAEILLSDGTSVIARVLGRNSRDDLALLKIQVEGAYAFTELVDAGTLADGTAVVAGGHHGGFWRGRPAPLRAGRVLKAQSPEGIVTNCQLAPGDSGGPLFDLQGRLVGIHSGIVEKKAGRTTHGPVSLVRRDWERYLAGECWGKEQGADIILSKAKLAGLDMTKFSAWVMSRIGQGGELKIDIPLARTKMLEFGMARDALGKMLDKDIDALTDQVLAISGRTTVTETLETFVKYSHDSHGNEILPTDAELHGLDFTAFRKDVIMAARTANGILIVGSKTARDWLEKHGMNKAKLTGLSDTEAVEWIAWGVGMEPGLAVAEEKSGMQQDINPVLLALEEAEIRWVESITTGIAQSVVRLEADGKDLALGSVVTSDGRILTKLSQIKDTPNSLHAVLADGRRLPAKLVRSFASHDLAILEIEANGLQAIIFPEMPTKLVPGTLIFSPGAGAGPHIVSGGIVSVSAQASAKGSQGLLPLTMSPSGDGLQVLEIPPGSTAARSGLKVGDSIVSINGVAATDLPAMAKMMEGKPAGEKLQVTYSRNQKSATCEVEMEESALASETRDVSSHRSGYPVSFENDQPLKPEQCGGPLIAADGKVIGVNIARSSRAASKAIPSEVIATLLKD